MHILMITNDTNFAWNLRREILVAFIEKGHRVSLIAQVLEFKEEFESLGVHVINLNVDRRGTNPLSDIALLNGYYSILKSEKPDIVFTNNIKPNVYAGIACQLLKIPYIANITGLGTPVENPGKLQKLSILLYKTGVRKAKTIFFQNTENQIFFHDHGMMPKNAHEVLLPGSGVNLETHPVLPWPEGPIHFLYIARIMKEKGIDLFLAAARKYASDDVIFDICGQCDDPYYKKILEKEKAVVYHGLQKDVVPFYQKCSCFLYPSYYPEGMSNVLLEAAACGRPVIATDRAGCREIVDDGITGFIIPVREENAVLDAVERYLNMTRKNQKQMGLAGRYKMEKEFNREFVVEKYISELN